MKEKTEKTYKEKSRALAKKYKAKEKLISRTINSQNEAKAEQKKKWSEELIAKENKAMDIIQDVLSRQEEERLRIEYETMEKMNSLEKKHNQKKKKKHAEYLEKRQSCENKFEKNIENIRRINEEKQKQNKESILKKFQAYYYGMKDRERHHRHKLILNNNRHFKKDERWKELEKSRDKKRREIMKKMKDMAKKLQRHEKEKEDWINQNKEIQQGHIEKIFTNQSRILHEEKDKRGDLLNQESVKLGRAIYKDSGVDWKKSFALKLIIQDQMDYEEYIKFFNKRYSQIQSESVMKMTKTNQMQMYKKMLKDEKERKWREEEEKLALKKN